MSTKDDIGSWTINPNIITILTVVALSAAYTGCKTAPADPELVNAYRAIEVSFNRRLSGRFPFCDSSCSPGAEARPAEIQAVYQQLEQIQNTGGIETFPRPQREFLEALDRTRAYLQPLSFTMASATEGKHASGPEQVVEQAFSSGVEKYTLRNTPVAAEWRPGEPVAFRATWANTSRWKPVNKPGASTFLRVNQLQAGFDYAGIWSLLRMLRAHTVTQPRAAGSGYILRFEVPTATKNPTNQLGDVAVLSIRMVLAGAEGSESLLPTFPVTAPALK